MKNYRISVREWGKIPSALLCLGIALLTMMPYGSALADRDEPDRLIWSTFLGGSSLDYGIGYSLDCDGNHILAGGTYSDDFPTTAGVFDETFNGTQDGYIAKISSDGSELLWCTYLGTDNDDVCTAVAVDAEGNIFVTGYTLSSSFPVSVAAFDQTWNGGSGDAFLAKFSTEGALLWSSYLGGNGWEWPADLALDPSGNPIVVGLTYSTNLPTTPDAYDTTPNGDYDGWVAKADASGVNLLWCSYLGGSDVDYGLGIAVDDAGDVLLAGDTYSTDFPTTPGTFDESYNGTPGTRESWVSKLAADGGSLIWSSFLGGEGGLPNNDWDYFGFDLILDAEGAPIVGNWTKDDKFPTTTGAWIESYQGNQDGIVSKLSADGSTLLWSSFVGGNMIDAVGGLDIDGYGRIAITCGTSSSDFPVSADAYDESHNSNYDISVTLLDSDGGEMIWSSFIGASSIQVGYGCAFIPLEENRLAVMGRNHSTAFPSTPGAYDETHNGSADMVLFTLDISEGTWVSGHAAPSAAGFALGNHPNPFNPGTTISYQIAETGGRMSLDLFDTRGRHLQRLVETEAIEGMHQHYWNGRDGQGQALPSGIYFIRIEAPQGNEERKVVLLK
jgi:hypothetical protein